MNETRGERNNNPGNIRKSPIAWQGEIPGADTEFETFSSPEKGIRALAKLLRHYGEEGYDTIAKIVNRYAPANENDTAAYIEAVCKSCVIPADATLNLESDALLFKLVSAIILHENGRNNYSEVVIARAIASI